MNESTEQYRNMLVEKSYAASQDFDKLTVTLSGGALALSLTFIHDIAPHPRQLWLAGTAWFLLALSLVFIFFSLFMSQKAIRDMIDQLDAGTDPGRLGPAATWTVGLNIASAATLVLGLVFLAAFALINL